MDSTYLPRPNITLKALDKWIMARRMHISIRSMDPGYRREQAYWWGRDMKNHPALAFVHENYSYSDRKRGAAGYWLYD